MKQAPRPIFDNVSSQNVHVYDKVVYAALKEGQSTFNLKWVGLTKTNTDV